MLRRRRRDGDDSPGRGGSGDPGDRDIPGEQGGPVPDGDELTGRAAGGPWDIADSYPPAERIDFGSLLIPVREGFDVAVEDQGSWVALVHHDTAIQLRAFAAPRSGGLWDEVRNEIAASLADSGGSCADVVGPFGPELSAQLPVAEEGQPVSGLLPFRFLGFDGPRWFLHGVISGPAASDPVLTESFDALFADVVVVRGDYPAPPREQLAITLPAERKGEDEQQQGQDEPDWHLPDPFTRGPEITEIR